jgi:hypothetical protein
MLRGPTHCAAYLSTADVKYYCTVFNWMIACLIPVRCASRYLRISWCVSVKIGLLFYSWFLGSCPVDVTLFLLRFAIPFQTLANLDAAEHIADQSEVNGRASRGVSRWRLQMWRGFKAIFEAHRLKFACWLLHTVGTYLLERLVFHLLSFPALLQVSAPFLLVTHAVHQTP